MSDQGRLTPRSSRSGKGIRVAMALVEVLTFGMALAISIPPIPSDEATHYSAMPVMVQGGAFFMMSLLISRWRVGEQWAVMAAKLAIYLALVWSINFRVLMG